MVTEFLLMGFADREKVPSHDVVPILMYLATLLGNLLIVSTTTLDQNLHTPMYFLLRKLPILDMCYISVTVPDSCVNSFTDNRAISLAGCAAQIFFVIYYAFVEFLFPTIVAHDRYVAIYQPLHYPIIMNHQFCVWTTLVSLLSGLIYAAVHTGNIFRLSFCQSNMVHQFFCDIPFLLSLSCSDTFSNFLLLSLPLWSVVAAFFNHHVIHSHIFHCAEVSNQRARQSLFHVCPSHPGGVCLPHHCHLCVPETFSNI
nr:olfactory receptor 14C36-like [Manis javanica]